MFDRLLNRLPPYRGNYTVIKNGRQSFEDIKNDVLKAHTAFARHYDTISHEFNEPGTLEKLFGFCQDELHYKEESGAYQTTRSPAAILHLGKSRSLGVDCKHYANFIAGVLDAKNRSGQGYYNFRYRFMNNTDADPNHVFVIVKTKSGEIWIDPTPIKDKNRGYIQREFNDRYLIPVRLEDKKPSTMIARLSGASTNTGAAYTVISEDSCKNIGQSYIGQSEEDEDDAFFVQLLNKAVEEVKKFFDKVFNSGWEFTTGVRWLTAYYQYYVLGQADATSSNKVDERYTPDAQGWFALVLGVPIYDRYRLHALMGTNPADGAPLNKTDAQKVQEYLAFGPDTANVNPAEVMEAVQIAKQFKWGTPAGSWARFSVAAPQVGPPPPPPPPPIGPGSGETTPPSPAPGGTGTPKPEPDKAGFNTAQALLIAGLGAGALYMANKPKPKKVGQAKKGSNSGWIALGVAGAVTAVGWYILKQQSIAEKRKYLAAQDPDDPVWQALALETMTDEEIEIFYEVTINYSESNPVPENSPLRAKLNAICIKYNICT